MYDTVLYNTPIPCDINKNNTELHRKCANHLRGRCNHRVLLSGRASYVRSEPIVSFTLVCDLKERSVYTYLLMPAVNLIRCEREKVGW
jgi:hypothetical protein